MVIPYTRNQFLDTQKYTGESNTGCERAYIFMAIHAETLHLHNSSIIVSFHQFGSRLELRFRSIVLVLINRHDGCCKEVY